MDDGPFFWPKIGIARAAYLAGFVVALLASGSLICERLAEGHSPLGWFGTLAVTASAILLVASGKPLLSLREIHRSHFPGLVGAHLLGIATGILLVHVVATQIPNSEHLIERPAQFVNDLVLASTTLALVWSFVAHTRVMRTLLPLLSVGLLAAYAMTMANWHLDPFPGFEVQRYVLGQAFSIGSGLLLFHWIGGLFCHYC